MPVVEVELDEEEEVDFDDGWDEDEEVEEKFQSCLMIMNL